MAQDEYLHNFLLVASEKAITKKWLQANLSSKDIWIAVVNKIHCMEKSTFSLKKQYIGIAHAKIRTALQVAGCSHRLYIN